MMYRKKHVIVDAFRLGFDNYPRWFIDRVRTDEADIVFDGCGEFYAIIATLEGKMVACKGDYIIEGVQGEIYPCKPEIFEKTYEKVEG